MGRQARFWKKLGTEPSLFQWCKGQKNIAMARDAGKILGKIRDSYTNGKFLQQAVRISRKNKGCSPKFQKNKGQIRDIPRQNIEKNKGQCLGKKLHCPIQKIISVVLHFTKCYRKITGNRYFTNGITKLPVVG